MANYNFIFSSDVNDWIGKSKDRELEKEKQRKRYHAKKSQPKKQSFSRFQMMNDQLRAR